MHNSPVEDRLGPHAGLPQVLREAERTYDASQAGARDSALLVKCPVQRGVQRGYDVGAKVAAKPLADPIGSYMWHHNASIAELAAEWLAAFEQK